MRNPSNYCNVIFFFEGWQECELHRLQNIWGNNIDIDDTALGENVCYFQHTAVRWATWHRAKNPLGEMKD